MDDLLQDVLALDEAYLTCAIAQEVFGVKKLGPGYVNEDGIVVTWVSDEEERAFETGQFSQSMDVALGLLRAIGNQLSRVQRLRLMRASAAYLEQILGASGDEAGVVLLEVIGTLTPFQIAQAFLAAWRYEVDNYGALRPLREDFLMSLE